MYTYYNDNIYNVIYINHISGKICFEIIVGEAVDESPYEVCGYSKKIPFQTERSLELAIRQHVVRASS